MGGSFRGEVVIQSGSLSYRGPYPFGTRTLSASVRWPGGDFYEGGLEKGQLSGLGKLWWANGDCYEGEFKGGRLTGRGKYWWANGDCCKGTFSNGQLTGLGKLWWANGDCYEGEFKGGQPDGNGTLTTKGGERRSGRWTHGEFIEMQPDVPKRDQPGNIPKPRVITPEDWHPAYDTLDEKQKRAYKMMEAAFKSFQTHADAPFLTIDEGKRTMEAFSSDHPELFWTSEKIVLWHYDDGMLSNFRLEKAPNRDAIERMDREIKAVLSTIRIDGSTDFEKIKEINRWLCVNLVYDRTTENSGNAYGAFVEKRCRCAGYARAVNYLCKLHGIESLYITGQVKKDIETGDDNSHHAWNLVKIEGTWYHLDATWNDSDCPGYAGYDYFLLGSNSMTRYGPLKDSRTATHYFGKTPSQDSYDWDPRKGSSYMDYIPISCKDLNEYAKTDGFWTYSMKDFKFKVHTKGMRRLGNEMNKREAETFYVLVEWHKPSAIVDRADDFNIRMFLDQDEISLSSLMLGGSFAIVLPKLPGKTAVFFDTSGRRLQKGEELPLRETGTYAYRYMRIGRTDRTIDSPIFRMIPEIARNSFYYSVCIHRTCT